MRGTKEENSRRFTSACCGVQIVLGAGRQWWCTACCNDVPAPVSVDTHRESNKPLIQRAGKDMDPVKPWQWATLPGRSDPVEIVSYPSPAKGATEINREATIMVRMTVGDPTSIKEVLFRHVACFSPDRHEWFYRPKRFYSDNPTAFFFRDREPPARCRCSQCSSTQYAIPGAFCTSCGKKFLYADAVRSQP